MDAIETHEQELIAYVFPKLQAIEGLTIYGSQDLAQRSGVIAFNLGDLHPHDLATALDYEGVAVRAGHHCAQPLLQFLEVPATARASFYIYNTKADCDKLVDALLKTKEFFNGIHANLFKIIHGSCKSNSTSHIGSSCLEFPR